MCLCCIEKNHPYNSDMSSITQETKQVLVPYPVDKAYDYAVPDHMQAPVDGAYVTVTLGSREVTGVVWGQGGNATPKTKAMIAVHDLPPMPQAHRDFLTWMARYTMNPLGSVLKLCLSAPRALDPPKAVTAYKASLNPPLDHGLSPAAKRVMDVAKDGLPRRLKSLSDAANCSSSVIKGLHEKGFLTTISAQDPPPCVNPDYARDGADLSDIQQEAADALCEMVSQGRFSAALLDGVTGAGLSLIHI